MPGTEILWTLMMVKGVRKMSEIDDLLGKPGESVPVVDAADLKVMWDYSQEVLAMHPGATGAAVGAAAWKDMCRPGTDIRAAGYRFTILMMLRCVWVGGEPSENAFKVAATIDLTWPPVGVVQQGSLFNLDRFVVAVQHGIGC
jgi:hypothetical protein